MPPTRSSEPGDPGAPLLWEEAVRRMGRCTRCHLSQSRRNVVIYRGSPHPRILFIGESPGQKEDETGLPFMGAAGRVLTRGIETLGLGPDDYGITNTFMCHPPGNVFDPEAARACRDWLDLKIRLLTPQLLVTLGHHALEALEPRAGPMLEVSGESRLWRGQTLLPLLHPAATLRNSRFKERWQRDLGRLRDSLASLEPGWDALK